MKVLLLLAVVAAVFIDNVTPAATAQQCYECITRHASWELEPCPVTTAVTCKMGNFCTKAVFGGSLVIRGCAPGATEKEFKEKSLCDKTKEYMQGSVVTGAAKGDFIKLKKVFEEACPAGIGDKLKAGMKNLVKTKVTKKGYTCKKKLCNGGGRIDAAAVSVFAAAATAIYAVKRGF